MEIWKIVKDIPRLEISNLGNVRCSSTKRRWYTKPDKLGYVCGQYRINGKRISFKVHRLVALEFLDNSDGYPEVNHIDGDKLNNAVCNLEWCTRSHNVKHSFDLGLNSSKGSNNGRAKLTEEVVVEICEWFQESALNTPTKAVEMFGVSIQQASKIRAKIAWKHITNNYTFQKLR